MGSYSPGNEPNRCTAKAKTANERCRNPVVYGRPVCRIHGGLGGRPPTTGKYSSAAWVADAYQRSCENPEESLDLRDEIALMQAILERLGERASELDTPKFRAKALELYKASRDITEGEGDDPDARRKFAELGRLLQAGVAHDRATAQIIDTAEKTSRRIEAYWKLRLQAHDTMSRRELEPILAMFMTCVEEEAGLDVGERIFTRLDRYLVGGLKKPALESWDE